VSEEHHPLMHGGEVELAEKQPPYLASEGDFSTLPRAINDEVELDHASRRDSSDFDENLLDLEGAIENPETGFVYGNAAVSEAFAHEAPPSSEAIRDSRYSAVL
jgi:hypothetical protein